MRAFHALGDQLCVWHPNASDIASLVGQNWTIALFESAARRTGGCWDDSNSGAAEPQAPTGIFSRGLSLGHRESFLTCFARFVKIPGLETSKLRQR